jgi:archaellum component FlaC
MNNFINVRMTSHNNLKIFNNIKHNCRYRKSLSQFNEMKNILIDLEFGMPLFEFNADDREMARTMYYTFSKLYQKDRTIHHQLHKENRGNRRVKDSFGSWGEMVFTFSEAIDHDLGSKYTQEELIKVAHECASDLCKKMGTELKMMNIDFDEKRPHFQMFFRNYDELGASIYYKHKNTKFLEEMQDIGFNHFGKLGMKRGIPKDESLKGVVDYISPKQYHQKILAQLSNEITSLDTEVKELKALRKEISSDVNLSNKEKKSLHDDISELQTQKRQLRKRLTQDKKSLKVVDDDIKQDINLILAFAKKTIGYDEMKLKKAIYSKYKKYLHVLEENQKLKAKNEKIENAFNKLYDASNDFIVIENQNKQLLKNLEVAKSSYDSLKKKYDKLDDENIVLKGKLSHMKNQEINSVSIYENR